MLDNALKGSPIYWGWIISAPLVGAGFVAYLYQFSEGLKSRA
jgi:hypothetical protein